MINNPLFSVLIAQYNNGKYLQDAINSVKEQTYTNWEIILVDDASTDNSKELYKLYENGSRIKIFYNEENKGCGYTKRRCAELANGEICGFLDPDDALLPNALELMVKEHFRDENISLIYSKFIFCDEKLSKKGVNKNAKVIEKNSDYLHINCAVVSHFVSFKKALYDKTEGINSQFKRAIDQDLYYKLEEVGTLFFIDKPLYLYRVHSGGISVNENAYKALFWHIKAIDMACQRRNLKNDAEIISSNIINSIVQSYKNHVEYLKKHLYQPSLLDVIKAPYKYFENIIKKVFANGK